MQQPTEQEKRKALLIERAHRMFAASITATKFGPYCSFCNGHEEGDEKIHSFIHEPWCPILLISDFCRLGE